MMMDVFRKSGFLGKMMGKAKTWTISGYPIWLISCRSRSWGGSETLRRKSI